MGVRRETVSRSTMALYSQVNNIVLFFSAQPLNDGTGGIRHAS
jgi:hypothetical protein